MTNLLLHRSLAEIDRCLAEIRWPLAEIGWPLAEVNWVQFIITCGIVAGVAAVGVYVVMAIRDWMAAPQDYSTTGDDLEALRAALQRGSIDEAEYRKGVLALRSMTEKLNARPPEPLGAEAALGAIVGSIERGTSADGPVFQEIGGSQLGQGTESDQDTEPNIANAQATEAELPSPKSGSG